MRFSLLSIEDRLTPFKCERYAKYRRQNKSLHKLFGRAPLYNCCNYPIAYSPIQQPLSSRLTSIGNKFPSKALAERRRHTESRVRKWTLLFGVGSRKSRRLRRLMVLRAALRSHTCFCDIFQIIFTRELFPIELLHWLLLIFSTIFFFKFVIKKQKYRNERNGYSICSN